MFDETEEVAGLDHRACVGPQDHGYPRRLVFFFFTRYLKYLFSFDKPSAINKNKNKLQKHDGLLAFYQMLMKPNRELEYNAPTYLMDRNT